MRPSRHIVVRIRRLAGIALGVLVLLYGGFYAVTCAVDGPQRAYRQFAGEPGAQQDVNDAADWLSEGKRWKDLEAVADSLLREFEPNAMALPRSRGGLPLIPVERLPTVYGSLRGSFRSNPEVVLLSGEDAGARGVRLQWGNDRHAIVVYATAPPMRPEGRFVRMVSERVYVVAR